MKNPTLKLVTFATIAAALALSINLFAQESDSGVAAPQTTSWQHLAMAHPGDEKWNSSELAQKINQLGRDGWEMVTVLNFTKDGTTDNTIYYFKKPL